MTTETGATTECARGPLSHIRVLDLSTFVAGPVVATLLGDFGAEVVKIEQPRIGDPNRLRGAEGGPGCRSLLWLQEARNRSSLAVDLRHPEGQRLVHSMLPEFDVVVTNYRPATLTKWQLDPETLQALHPRGIYVYVTGYGLDGPYADRGSLDRVASAYSGQTYVSGNPDGPPMRAGNALVDYMTGYLAAYGTMTAIYERDHNGGTGQVIDLGLFEAALRASEETLAMHSVHGAIRGRNGNRNAAIVPASDFLSGDGRYVVIHAGTDAMFRRLAEVAMGRPELLTDPRFASYGARVEHQEELYGVIGDWVRGRTADEAMESLVAADVPASPIMNIAEIVVDPHIIARGAVHHVQVDGIGNVAMPAVFPRLSGTPGSIRSVGPGLGEGADDVLTRLAGLTESEIAALRADGVIG